MKHQFSLQSNGIITKKLPSTHKNSMTNISTPTLQIIIPTTNQPTFHSFPLAHHPNQPQPTPYPPHHTSPHLTTPTSPNQPSTPAPTTTAASPNQPSNPNRQRHPGRPRVGHDDAAVADAAGRTEEVGSGLAPLRQLRVQLWRQRPGARCDSLCPWWCPWWYLR